VADRVTSYVFRGNFSNLGAGLTTMGKGVNDLGLKLTALDKQGATSRRGLTQIGSTAGKIGLVAAAGVGAIVLATANFEQSMSRVQAATGASADGLGELRDAAIKAGAATVFSASEAADAITAMSKAGVSAKDILSGGLDGALALASAGELDVATAADIAATAMNQFGLAGKDIPHIADLLAAGAASAQGEVTDFATALKYVGPVAHQMGISIEETTGVIAELASQGVLADQAGTSLRGMLTALTSPSVMAAKEMKGLGIALYDSSGQFVGFDGVAQQLHETLGGLTNAERDQALGRIFGNEQITAARILYAGGADAVSKWTDAVDKDGAAADIAATKMNNLKGDLEQLKGSLETALIGAGSSSQGPLRSVVQDATKAVNAFVGLPGPIKSTVTALGGLTAITGGSLWFGTKVIRGISDTKQALKDLGVSATTTSRAMTGLKIAGGVATGLALAAAAIRAINDASRDSLPGVEQLTEGLLNLGKGGDVAALGVQFQDLGDDLDRLFNKSTDERLGDALFTPFKGILGNTQDTQEALDEIDALDAALANLANTRGPQAAADALQALADSGGVTAYQLEQLKTKLPQYDDALAGLRLSGDTAAGAQDNLNSLLSGTPVVAGEAASATDGLATSTANAGAAADDAAQNTADLVKAMTDQKNAAVDAFDAITGYRQAMKDADKQARKNNAGIQGDSKAVLANRDALSGLISHWNSLDQTVTDNVAKFKQAKDNFIKTAVAMGVPKKAAEDLWKEMAKIPSSKVVPVTTPGMADATSKAQTLKGILDSLHSKDINIALHYQTIGNKPHAPIPGDPNGRIAARGLTTRTPSLRELDGTKVAYANQALGLLTKNSDDAAKGAKGLKEQLHEVEHHLAKVSKAADDAHAALDSLRSQKADLSSSVSGSLAHDAFGGDLSTFNAQTQADTADAQAVLAALKTLVSNGLDPHSDLFKRLAASGNVALIQEFAALTRAQLAGEAASFAAGQSALTAVGQFAGGAAFNDLISKQAKVTDHLDDTVHHLSQQVHHLEQAIKDLPKHVKQASKEGSKEGTREGSEAGARAGMDERDRRLGSYVRTGPSR
jgi:TP901 family phage tail tape measure protein